MKGSIISFYIIRGASILSLTLGALLFMGNSPFSIVMRIVCFLSVMLLIFSTVRASLPPSVDD